MAITLPTTRRARRTARRPAAAAAALLGACLAAGLAACSSGGSGGSQVPTAAGTGSGAGAADQASLRRAWVQCMHEAGQAKVMLSPAGEIMLPASGPDDSAGGEALAAAVRGCNTKVPGVQQDRRSDDPRALQAARDLAACLRANGVPSAADPVPADGGALALPADADPQALAKALAGCGRKYPGVPVKNAPAARS